MPSSRPPDHDKRRRDREHDARRTVEKPWRAWYRTKEWRRRSYHQLHAEPWCRMCAAQGKRVKATIADHIDRHGGDYAKFFAGRLQSLCAHHHNSAKQSMERGAKSGCDESGLPTDPTHPWGGG